MNIKFFFYLCLITLGVQAQTATKNWTLQACISHAIQNNISVKGAELDKELTEINQRGALGSFLPSVGANANHSWNVGLTLNEIEGNLRNQTTQFSSFSLNSNIVIYNGLQNQNRYRRAQMAKIAADYQLNKIQEDIALNVANSYLQILFNKENVKIQQQQLLANELQLKRSEELVKGGRIPEGDLLNLKATVAQNKQQLIVAENNLYISKLSLAQLLLLDNPTAFDIALVDYDVENSSILLQTPSSIFEKAKQERIEIKIAQANTDLAQKDITIAKGAMMPTLSGFYSFNTRISYADVPIFENNTLVAITSPPPFTDQFRDNKGHSFGLSLNIPIFNGFTTRNNIDRSKVAFERAKLNAKQAEINLERTIHTAYSDTQAALKSYEASEETLKARQEALRYAKERYEAGMSNSFDLNQAQTLLNQSQADVIKAKYDYLFRLKILELYFGIKLF